MIASHSFLPAHRGPTILNRPWRWIFAVISLLTLALGAWVWSATDGEGGMAKMTALVRSKFPGVPQLRPAKLAAWLADKKKAAPQLLDVREPEEFAVSHLPGAINIRPDASGAEALAKIDPAKPMVLYCSVGYRSSQLAERLMKAGAKNVSNLEGSIFAWANEGRPLEKDGQPAKVVHPYNRVFGRLLKPEYRSK
jgi:rhodanese-related sulfurtransferase